MAYNIVLNWLKDSLNFLWSTEHHISFTIKVMCSTQDVASKNLRERRYILGWPSFQYSITLLAYLNFSVNIFILCTYIIWNLMLESSNFSVFSVESWDTVSWESLHRDRRWKLLAIATLTAHAFPTSRFQVRLGGSGRCSCGHRSQKLGRAGAAISKQRVDQGYIGVLDITRPLKPRHSADRISPLAEQAVWVALHLEIFVVFVENHIFTFLVVLRLVSLFSADWLKRADLKLILLA